MYFIKVKAFTWWTITNNPNVWIPSFCHWWIYKKVKKNYFIYSTWLPTIEKYPLPTIFKIYICIKYTNICSSHFPGLQHKGYGIYDRFPYLDVIVHLSTVQPVYEMWTSDRLSHNANGIYVSQCYVVQDLCDWGKALFQ